MKGLKVLRFKFGWVLFRLVSRNSEGILIVNQRLKHVLSRTASWPEALVAAKIECAFLVERNPQQISSRFMGAECGSGL